MRALSTFQYIIPRVILHDRQGKIGCILLCIELTTDNYAACLIEFVMEPPLNNGMPELIPQLLLLMGLIVKNRRVNGVSPN